MKKLFILFVLNFLFGWNSNFAQTVGDYRTATTSVIWSTANHWQTWNGTNWVVATVAPDSANNVFVQAGHTAKLTAYHDCNNLYISTGTTNSISGGDGLVQLDSNELSLHGKLSCYYGTCITIVNSTYPLTVQYSTSVPPLGISKLTGGALKVVGTSRNITNVNEWEAITTGAYNLFDIIIAMDSGQTATFKTSLKAANWIFLSGITNMETKRIAADNGTSGQGDVTIGENAIVISYATGYGNAAIISQNSINRSGTVTINGLLRIMGSAPHIECNMISVGTNGTVEYGSFGNQTFVTCSLTSTKRLKTYSNIIISGSGIKTTLGYDSTKLSAYGTLTLSGGSLVLGAGATFYANPSATTLVYSGTAAQTASTTEWQTNFKNITINNSSGVTLGFARTINGTLNLSTGTFSNSSYLTLGTDASIIKTGGSLNSTPTFGSSINVVYNQHSGSITTGSELPSGTGVLNNLTINNSHGVTLLASTTVNGVLTLSSGNLTTSSSEILTLTTTGSVTGFSDSSFVDGPIAKSTNSITNFIFPIGKDSLRRGISITPADTNTTTYTAQYFNSAYSNTNSYSSPLTRVSMVEYFILNRSSSSLPANAFVTLEWGHNSGVNTSNVGELTIARWDGNSWQNEAAIGTGDSNYGTITTNNAVSTFGIFTLANSITNTNPLPVKFLFFKGNFNNPFIILNWATASETNCLGFEIQKSPNGIEFNKIGFTPTKALGSNSNITLYYSFIDQSPTIDVSFYRLKQIDNNGQVQYSTIIKKQIESNKWFIKDNTLYVSIKEGNLNGLTLFNSEGKEIMKINFENETSIDISFLPVGLYYLRINHLNPIKFFACPR